MKKLFFLSLLTLGVSIGLAQVSFQSNSSDGKLRVGGNLGFNFGNNSYFGFNVSPSAGYMLMDNLEAGITVGYQYAKNDFYKSNLFSGGPYANYYIMPELFARAHYEYFTGNQTIKRNDYKVDFDESALWIGGGYQSTGPIRFQAGLMYNVLYKENKSIFSSALRPFAGASISL